MSLLLTCFALAAIGVYNFRSYKISIYLAATQALFLVVFFYALALSYDAAPLKHWAVVAFFVKVLLVPALLFYLVKKMKVEFEDEPTGGFLLNPLIAVALSLGSAGILTPILQEFGLIKFDFGIFVALFVFSLGICAFMLRNSLVKHILAYCLFENGIHLLLALNAYNAHSLVEVAILTDAVFAVVILALIAKKFHTAFVSTDISEASNLRG